MDKRKEKNILRSVFDSNKYFIDPDDDVKEEPDFILLHNGERFGVEITELHFSTLHARLSNDDRYRQQMLSLELSKQGKKDLKKIGGVKITYLQNPVTEKYLEIDRIINYKKKSLEDFCSKLSEIIMIKDKRYESYSKKVSICDLIIYDSENYWGNSDISQIEDHEKYKDFWKTIVESSFRRIYLLSSKRGYRMCTVFGEVDEGIEISGCQKTTI